jgi:hypothetical protein
VRQIADVMVLDRPPLPADHHQAGVHPMLQGFLGDEVAGEFVFEGNLAGGHEAFWWL